MVGNTSISNRQVVSFQTVGKRQMSLDISRIGKYEITDDLGSGGMGVVYKAWQPAMNRFVAIKVLPEVAASNEVVIARFEREARTIASLEHSRILPVYDFGNQDGLLYIVMRYMASGTLADVMSHGPLPLERANRFLSQIAEGLEYAHRKGVIHRDIKPSNIMVDDSDDIYIADFGLAKDMDTAASLTGEQLIGSPAYMSPEQSQGEVLDGRTDVYSLGVVLYQMVTGRLPYTASTPISLILKHVNDPLPSARNVNPSLSTAVDSIIKKALAKDPRDRYQTASKVARDFQRAVHESPTNPIHPEELEAYEPAVTHFNAIQPAAPAAKEKRSSASSTNWFPLVLGVLGTLLVVGLIALGILLLTNRDSIPTPQQAAPPTIDNTVVEQPGIEEPSVQPTVEEESEPALNIPANAVFVDTFDAAPLGSAWQALDGTLWEVVNGQLQANPNNGGSVIKLTEEASGDQNYYLQADVTSNGGLVALSNRDNELFSVTRQGTTVSVNNLRDDGPNNGPPISVTANGDASNPLTLLFVLRNGTIEGYYRIDQGSQWVAIGGFPQFPDREIEGVGLIAEGSTTIDNVILAEGVPNNLGQPLDIDPPGAGDGRPGPPP